MDQGESEDYYYHTSSDPVDKSRVLNVKPMRVLYPEFKLPPNLPSSSQPQGAAPFLSVSPTGPFPPGAVAFFPFSVPQSQKSAVPNQAKPPGFATPIQAASTSSAFRTPLPHMNGGSGTSIRNSRKSTTGQGDGYDDSQSQSVPVVGGFSVHIADVEENSAAKRQRGRPRKKSKGGEGAKFPLPDIDPESFISKISLQKFRQDEGDNECVQYLLTTFNLLRRKIGQIEDSKEDIPGASKRPDLRAGTILMSKGVRTNTSKRIGAVPGVEVGDIFYFRIEMCLLGLHSHVMSGIDYMTLKMGLENEPLATSVVSSGGYEDSGDDGDVLIYSGQGGNLFNNRNGKDLSDQKLERGNLALEKTLHRGNEVRVIRGVQDALSRNKVYVYDGLYKIEESWLEQGKLGCNVFKYKFVRIPGQPEAFTIWKTVQQWKNGAIPRTGVILSDLSSGTEKLPVSLVNDVDDEKRPAPFDYIPCLNYVAPMSLVQSSHLCSCKSGCQSGDPDCSCIQKNGGCLPYTSNGVLVRQKKIIYECGSSCACSSTCWNRASQEGLKIHLEVFKTKTKGWAIRSWDPIRVGAFVCEYAGEAVSSGNQIDDKYVFDCTRSYEPQEVLPGDCSESPELPFPLAISAKNGGNVARFMNHSCSPNLMWQPIVRHSNNEYYLCIGFFAIRNIPPMTELTYDYGIIQSDYLHERGKKCLCGMPRCRGYF